MKKYVYIMLTLLIIIFNFISCVNCVYADGEDSIALEGWNKIYKKTGNSFDKAQNAVIGLVQTIGYITSVLMVTIIGIKYIFTSPEGKAEVKKQLIPFLIGAVLLFSGTVLVSTISKWAYTTIK
ncbi:MAG: hypothetical protein HFJ20_05050 [Clostridia bacterium]|nr:hypothetical protein [Clostridia bacterium]